MIEEYYRAYLIRYPKLVDSKSRNIGTMDYSILGGEETVYDLLSFNRRRRGLYCNRVGEQYPYAFAQAFQTVGDSFHVIPGGTTDVVVHYGQAVELIDQLNGEGILHPRLRYCAHCRSIRFLSSITNSRHLTSRNRLAKEWRFRHISAQRRKLQSRLRIPLESGNAASDEVGDYGKASQLD